MVVLPSGAVSPPSYRPAAARWPAARSPTQRLSTSCPFGKMRRLIRALFAVLFFSCASRRTFQAVPLRGPDPSVQSGESTTARLASCNAEEVVHARGRLKPLDVLHRCQDDKHRIKLDGVALFQSSLGPPLLGIDSLIPSKSGFVSTLMQAYNGHHNLVIRPDDVWLSILARFNTYVNQNAEELRYKFVTHEGKKLVEIIVMDKDPSHPSDRYSYNWGTLGQALVKVMDGYLSDKALRPWILPNFTTTTELDAAVASAVMLSTFQGYFKYRATFSCGIPSVTLMGTRADWVSLLHRVEMLHHFDIGLTGLRKQASDFRRGRASNQHDIMAQWQHRLEAVLKRFIAMFDGEENEEFWSHIFTVKRYGSGSQRFLSGWVTAFATYEPGFSCGSYELDRVQFGCLNVENLPVDVVEVPIQINDHGYEVMGLLVAGVLGARKIDSTTIGLERAWWMFENKTAGWIK